MTSSSALDVTTRSRDLHEQHRNWARGGYDGHNRRSGLTPMSTLRVRRLRRRMHRSLVWLARAWEPAGRRATASAYTGLNAA